ncbi:Pentatricopeptide repeat-containing protein, mitochondrial [Symbiodinium microadriaticum]|uniref:Pentatricopeptide repeat-containing protein, mitochondrial n=1 Tax=Symbiodinium microadriaticum TaxID=2951 RepID=A0A1Q9F5N7_SYMMI|nr:Pentatricopeptide repeat-containing protein, mitochondrial [Symbiodinium microadriaticum]
MQLDTPGDAERTWVKADITLIFAHFKRLPKLFALGPPAEAGDFLVAAERKYRDLRADTRALAEFPFSEALGAAGQLRDLQAGERWFVRCLDAQGDMDSVALTAIIAAASKADDPRLAAERWFARPTSQPSSRSSQLEPCDDTIMGEVMFGGLLTAMANAGDLQAAELWFQRMTSTGVCPDVRAFAAMVAAAGKVQDLRAVKEWLQEARNAGHHPGVMALTTAAATAAKLGDVVSAEGFFAEAAAAPKGDDDSLDVAAYSAVVAAAAKAREIHKAERWLCRAAAAGEKCQPNAYTYTSVGTAALLDARRVLAWLDRATFALGFASTQPLHVA